MYKVFVNDKPLFLTNEVAKETDFQLFLLESVDIEQLIVKMFNNKINKAYLYYPDEKEILKKVKEKIAEPKYVKFITNPKKTMAKFAADFIASIKN